MLHISYFQDFAHDYEAINFFSRVSNAYTPRQPEPLPTSHPTNNIPMASNPIYGRDSRDMSNAPDYIGREQMATRKNPIYGMKISNDIEEAGEYEDTSYHKADENYDIAGYMYEEIPNRK